MGRRVSNDNRRKKVIRGLKNEFGLAYFRLDTGCLKMRLDGLADAEDNSAWQCLNHLDCNRRGYALHEEIQEKRDYFIGIIACRRIGRKCMPQAFDCSFAALLAES